MATRARAPFDTAEDLAMRAGLDQHEMRLLAGADALAIVTEWSEYRTPDFKRMLSTMKQPIVFDGRNIYDPAQMTARGFELAEETGELEHLNLAAMVSKPFSPRELVVMVSEILGYETEPSTAAFRDSYSSI